MKIMNTLKKKRLYQILLIVLAITFANCISDDYNLKNGVIKDITLGGDSLSFPIGKIKPILLSWMINNNNNIDILKKLSDGTYSLQLKDSTQLKVAGISPVTFTMKPFLIAPIVPVFSGTVAPPSNISAAKANNYSLQFISLNVPTKIDRILSKSNKSINQTSFASNTLFFDIPNQISDIVIHQFVSNDVKKIYSITLKKPAQLTFRLDIKNLPTSIDSIFFYNFTVKLPTFLKFQDVDVNSNNELILNNGFKVNNGYAKVLTFELLDFNAEGGISLDNGTLNLNKELSMKGAAYIKGANLIPTDIGPFEIQPSLIVGDMSISLIDGEIKPLINPIKKIISVNLPGLLKQTGNILDMLNPVITLQVGNSMGLLMDVGLNLIAKRNGSVLPNASISTQFSVPAADQIGQSKWINYWISKSNVGISAGYQPLLVPNMPILFKIAPDEIEINATPVINGNRQQVDLYSTKNQVDIKYSVNVPLDFGKDFKIQYMDTLSNLKKDLDQIVKRTSQVELIATIGNLIPLDLNFEVVPLDNSKQILTGISINNPSIIKSCNIDGTTQKSTLSIGIKETVPGELSKLDALQIKLTASKNSTVAGMPLKADQSLTIELRIKIPKGLTISQN